MLVEEDEAAKPRLRDRISRKVGGWMVRRLQKRLEREWREYDHSPKVSLGPWSRQRSARGDTQVYRSLVQIHFHPRERAGRQGCSE